MQPFQPSRSEWPIVIVVLAASAIVALYVQGCTLHTSVIGHRIDQPPVLVVTPTKPDDDGGDR